MTTANKSGNVLECLTAYCFVLYDLGYTSQYRLHGVEDSFGKEPCIDFFAHKASDFPNGFYVECRWQESKGTADEKTHALEHKIRNHYDRPTIVVCDGKHSVGIRTFLESRLGGNLHAVITLTEFAAFCSSLATGNGKAYILKEFNPNQKRLF